MPVIKSGFSKSKIYVFFFFLNKNTYQSTCKTNNCYWRLCRLRNVKKIIKECLVFLMSKKIKFIQDEDHWATASPVT